MKMLFLGDPMSTLSSASLVIWYDKVVQAQYTGEGTASCSFTNY